jgi:hypothetical protein
MYRPDAVVTKDEDYYLPGVSSTSRMNTTIRKALYEFQSGIKVAVCILTYTLHAV